jgi:hypothetical protein
MTLVIEKKTGPFAGLLLAAACGWRVNVPWVTKGPSLRPVPSDLYLHHHLHLHLHHRSPLSPPTTTSTPSRISRLSVQVEFG